MRPTFQERTFKPMNNPFESLKNVFFVFAVILIAGTVGYRWLEGFDWLQSFYMVIQTVSTVGFNEVGPLSTGGIWFTIALIVGSFGTFAYGAGLLAQLAIDGKVQLYLRTKRLERKVEKLRNHTIVCGLGRNGRQVVSKLKAYGVQVVVLELNEERANRYREELVGVLVLIGDATNDEILEKAKAKLAKEKAKNKGKGKKSKSRGNETRKPNGKPDKAKPHCTNCKTEGHAVDRCWEK